MGFYKDDEWIEMCGRFANILIEANSAVQRVRELHQPDEKKFCSHCAENGPCWGCGEYGSIDDCQCEPKYPCPTIKALDGE